MNGELFYTKHPFRSRLLWVVVYVFLVAAVVFGLYALAAKIQTHTLPTGSVELSVPYSKYLVGENITFTLKNKFNSSIYITNNCPSEPLEVYRLENGIWARIHDQASIEDCKNENRQVAVPANGEVNGTFAPWHNLFNVAGKYRLVASIEFYNSLPYQQIEIIDAPDTTSTLLQRPITRSDDGENTNTTSTQSSVRQSKTISTSKGTIDVQYDSGTIYVISVSPASGCSYEGGRSGRQVEVTFKCAGGETQVQLHIANGTIVSKIE